MAHSHGLLHEVNVLPVIACALVASAHKGLDHAHAGQVLLEHRVQLAQPALHLQEHRLCFGGKEPEYHHRRRHEHQHDQGQLPVGGEQQADAAHDHQRGAHEHPHREEYQPQDLHDVAGHAGHQLASLQSVQVRERERLNVSEQIAAQVGSGALRNLDSQQGVADEETGAHGSYSQHAQQSAQNGAHVALQDTTVDDRLGHAWDGQIGGHGASQHQ